MFVTLHFVVAGESEILPPEPDSHSITLKWNKICGDENYTVSYDIVWEDRRKEGSIITTHNYFVIDSLEAYVTYEVSVSVNCSESGAEISKVTKVTTIPAGKWHDSWLVHILLLTMSVYNILNNCRSYYKYHIFKPYPLHLQGATQVH